MAAAEMGQTDIAKFLIEKGAHIEAKIKQNSDYCESDGLNALMLAAKKGHIEIVKLLIDEGAHIEEKDM